MKAPYRAYGILDLVQSHFLGQSQTLVSRLVMIWYVDKNDWPDVERRPIADHRFAIVSDSIGTSY
jgi:hypothetical protein